MHLNAILLLVAIAPHLDAYPSYSYNNRYSRSQVPVRRNPEPDWLPDYPEVAYPAYAGYQGLGYQAPRRYPQYSPYDQYEPYYQNEVKYDTYPVSNPAPVYYNPRHRMRPRYYGYEDYLDPLDPLDTMEPLDDLTQEMMQEEARKEREEALPIGQETWFEHDDNDEDIANINRIFLKNLIASNVYNDNISRKNKAKNGGGKEKNMEGYILGGDYYDDGLAPLPANSDYYEDFNQRHNMNKMKTYTNNVDDEEVDELKKLTKHKNKGTTTTTTTPKPQTKKERKQKLKEKLRSTKTTRTTAPPEVDAWKNWDRKRDNDWPVIYDFIPKESTENAMGGSEDVRESGPQQSHQDSAPKDLGKGQKEIALLRPSAPVKLTASEPIIKLLSQSKEEAPNPNDRYHMVEESPSSVYDAIKTLLELQAQLSKAENSESELKPVQKKRIITNEASLVEELYKLKRKGV